MTVLVLLLFAAWLLISIGNQIRGPWVRFFGGLNTFALLPQLEFFAPDPIDVDYHLVFHDFLEGGKATPWRRIPTEPNGPFRLVWSTAKRDHQAMLGAVAAVAGLQQMVAPIVRDPAAVIQLSLPYLFLLHRVQAAPRPVGARKRQFMIVESTGFGASRRLALGILSNPHRLG